MAEQTKTTAKRKPAARKTPAKKTAAKRKPVAKKTTTRRAAPKKAASKTAPEFTTRAREASRNAFLASLGFYGKAFDQVQEQFDGLQKQMEERRAKADDMYQELVKRGKKVEKDAKVALDDIELPKIELESLTDRKKLDAQLKKAKARFEELRGTIGFNKAA